MAEDDKPKKSSDKVTTQGARSTQRPGHAPVEPTLPSPKLPKGGGAIAPIGEKLLPNPQMGTASFTVPVFTSAGRSDFGPKLTLSYDAGAGNGSYGHGWSLSVPNISRKTEKEIPRYNDAEDSDTFVLSGAEELVPIASFERNGETITRYRPRVDNQFSRIERRVRADGSSYWVSWTRDNVRSVFGHSPLAQLARPGHPKQVFRWLLEWSDDDRGNCIAYVHKPEDDVGVSRALHEQGRAHTNLYLKAIAYGSPDARASRSTPPLDLGNGRAAALADWPLVVLLDYGEHDAAAPTLQEGEWPERLDPFSSYRAGFEIRTHRLCQRILMLHRFPQLGSAHAVVRSTELKYKPDRAITRLHSVTQVGWKPNNGGGYDQRPMPAIVFEHGEIAALSHRVRFLDGESAQNLPEIDGTRYALVDYDGEGLPGVLTEQAGRGWFYKRPEGRDEHGVGRFGGAHAVHSRPASALGEGFQLQDTNGDGQVDLVRLRARPAGVFERSDNEWLSFRPFSSVPNIDWADPNLRFVDLDGDGFPDVLITDQEVIRWHRSLGREGYGKEEQVRKPFDRLEPVPLFATEREAVLLADMTGDGLSDIVHVRNGSVCYWPNFGYGRFGARVEMSNAPRLDSPEGFDPRRVRVGDIDGTGTSDLLYLGRDGVRVSLNQAGNSFATQPPITALPVVDSLSDFSVTDLWGTGTACLVWSTPAPGKVSRHLRWIDLLEGKKPHLLETIESGFGLVTRLEHAPSTKFYLEDRAANRPWITRLPFPVHVLAKATVEDLVSGTKLVTTYTYHHGFYDGVEREFRGFARVEQLDTQTVSRFAGKGAYPGGLDETLHIDPTLTKTWFHTGAFVEGAVSTQLAREYMTGGRLADSTIEGHPSGVEQREARRACRGRTLHQEVYALDGNDVPYVVTENNYTIRIEHAAAGDRHAVLSVHPRETLTHHLERRKDDGRVLHEVVLRVGPYGEIEETVSIAYPRAPVLERRIEQQRLWATHVRTTTTPHHDTLDEDYRVAVAFETNTSELIGLPDDHLLTFQEVVAGASVAERPWAPPEKRITPGRWQAHRTRVRYWDDGGLVELPPGQSGVRALESRGLTLALLRHDIDDLWKNRETGVDLLTEQAGYLIEGDLLWAFAGTVRYDASQFFLPVSLTNPFNGVARVHYELPALLLPDSTEDPAGNRSIITNDYRLLTPQRLTDPNQTTESVETDPLGVVVSTAVRGAAGEGGALTVTDYSFYSGPASPTSVHSVTMQEFGGTASEEDWVYSDGSGREVQRKRSVEPGPLDPNDPNSPRLDPRFVASGRTIFDNKANPVKQYEPYFAQTEDFDTEAALVQQGVTPILHYDPLGRLVRTDFPNGTYSQVLFDAWLQETWDEIDTLTATTPWVAARSTGAFAREPALEQAAADAALKLAQTPSRTHLDSLGRVVASVRDAGNTDSQRFHETSQSLDLDGEILTVTDPRKTTVATQRFDMAGRRLFLDNIDAGHAWSLPDALGQPLYVWRAGRGEAGAIRVRHEYDDSRRLIGVWQLPDGSTHEALRERIVYRDGATAPRYGAGRIFAELDGAGIVEYEYEFRGHPTRATRHLVDDPQSPPDWSASATWNGTTPQPSNLQREDLVATLGFDALARETRRQVFVGTRSGGTIRRRYDRAGQLFAIDADLPKRAQPTAFVGSIGYDARGRRVAVDHGNGASTTYTYDPFTFRLDTLTTVKGNQLLQALVYAYDPLGNVTAIRDDAQDTTYLRGAVKPQRDYGYDALYRLRRAVGREHLSQADPDQRDIPDPLALPVADPNDLDKIVQYIERYAYDPAGNLESVTHTGATSWTREHSLEPNSNRLAKTTVQGFDSFYGYDRRGNMTSMPHLASMTWDHRDRLIACTRTRIGNGPDPNAARNANNPVYFAYDAHGSRVVKQARTSTQIKERIYFGGFELHRERAGLNEAPGLERETLHITDGDQRVALVETRIVGTDPSPSQLVRYQHGDHLGSAVVELDESAAPLSYEEFHPYGGSALFAGLASKRYRYSGKERDEETGLGYHGARYYAYWLGRWTAADPAGLEAGINGYAYALDSPIVLFDPSGREPQISLGEMFGKVAESLRGSPDLLGDLPFDPSQVGGNSKDKPELYGQVQSWAKELQEGGIDPIKTLIDRATSTYESQLRESDAAWEKKLTGLPAEGFTRAQLDRQYGSWFGEKDAAARGQSKGERMVQGFRTHLERTARLNRGDHKDVARQAWAVIKQAYAELTPRGTVATSISAGIAIRAAGLSGAGFPGGGRSKPSGLGDLTKAEARQIQRVVDAAGRPLEVVGSAARGERRGVGTSLPIGKPPGARSDIDYLVPHGSMPYYRGLEPSLPSLDPQTGIVGGTHNPYMGPGIRFEPGASPRFVPGAK